MWYQMALKIISGDKCTTEHHINRPFIFINKPSVCLYFQSFQLWDELYAILMPIKDEVIVLSKRTFINYSFHSL